MTEEIPERLRLARGIVVFAAAAFTKLNLEEWRISKEYAEQLVGRDLSFRPAILADIVKNHGIGPSEIYGYCVYINNSFESEFFNGVIEFLDSESENLNKHSPTPSSSEPGSR